MWEEFASLARVGDEPSEFMKKIQTRGLRLGLALEYYLELREPGREGFVSPLALSLGFFCACECQPETSHASKFCQDVF